MQKNVRRLLALIMVLAMLFSATSAVAATNSVSNGGQLMAGGALDAADQLEGLEALRKGIEDGSFTPGSQQDYDNYFALRDQLAQTGQVKAQKDTQPAQEIPDQAYEEVHDVYDLIYAMEDAPAKKNASQTELTDAAVEIVMASEGYVEGSLDRKGDCFSWRTDDGIRCLYNPYMMEKHENMKAPANPEPSGLFNEPVAVKGGQPSGNQVYLIGPYYGIDDAFSNQYKNEATAIASAMGDTDGYTLYSGSSVTVDNVATAMENGAVVLVDSHGTTDYSNGYDYVTGADNSYICLTNRTGLTQADYNAGAGYFYDSDGVMCACINGATISNHMDRNSPSGLMWIACCLCMATDTICAPMRAKGVEVVYGYSQSVTFGGDYLYEETFWDNMLDGDTVAEAISAMKSQWGNWDWSTQIASNYGYSDGYSTIAAARADYAAFPVVVSDEDTFPGQRSAYSYGACSLQTVRSTYTLGELSEPSNEMTVTSVDQLQSPHPYANNYDFTWHYSHPTATSYLKITFSSDTETESSYDYIYIYDGAGIQISKWTGATLAGKTVTVNDDAFSIRLTSDYSNNCYGFKVTAVEGEEPSNELTTSSVSDLQSAHPYAANTDFTWHYIHPTSASSLRIMFSGDTKTEENYDYIYIYDGSGNQVGRYSGTTLADTAVTVSGNRFSIRLTSDASYHYYGFRVVSVTDATNSEPELELPELDGLQSAHPYANSMDETWEYNHPTAADMLEISFSDDTKTESGYDFIYIYDCNGDLAGKYSGTQLAGKTVTVLGDSFTIRLTSDGRTNAYGFRVTAVREHEETLYTPYQYLRSYINTYGSTNDDGVKLWLLHSETTNYDFFYVLRNESGGILIDYLAATKTSGGFIMDYNYLLQPNTWQLPIEFICNYYYNNYLYDRVDVSGTFDRRTLLVDDVITITLANPDIITSENATEMATDCHRNMCRVWDNQIYNTLGFGLKALGFDSYDGNGWNCSHSYDGSCDGICNICGAMRLFSHSFGSSCTSYNSQYHYCSCSCGVKEYSEHTLTATVIQQPTDDEQGIVRYSCTQCSYSRTEYVDFIMGDMNGDGTIDNSDVEYLLWYTLFPGEYPLPMPVDFNGDGSTDNADVEHLLWHTLFPSEYPLS